MDEGNSGSLGSCPPLSPLVLPRVPNVGPPSWSVPVGPLNPLGSPVGASLLRGDCKEGTYGGGLISVSMSIRFGQDDS